MSCDDVELTLALAAMGEVEDAASLHAAREHASGCARCGTLEGDYASMFDTMLVAAAPVAPPPGLRRRILDAVGASPARVQVRRDRGASWWRRAWERVPAGRPLTAVGFAGSAAAVALAAVIVIGSRGPSSVVSSPLQAGVNQPGLSGTLTYYRDSADALVSLRGLAASPRAADGSAGVYELWLMRGDRSVTPAGVLVQQADGTWRAVIHRGGAADVAVAATLEPAPGTQSPTGAEVFQAALPSS